MGQAQRNLDADARGFARPRVDRCPACRSRHVRLIQRGELESFNADADWQGCLDCKAVWEPFPAHYVRDPVCAEPCDNCAFRPGSPEQADPQRWIALIESLKPNEGGFGGRFYCHKGVPIDLSKGPGNFLFPRKPVLFDGKPLQLEDGSIATTEDTAKMRTCTGFLRMVWARASKSGRL